jgi:transcriptional regulator with XRE-family HTH domain
MLDMVRRVTKSRPKQGARLAELRKAAGFSQYELARLIGVPQPNIAFWELSAKPPRSEVLPKMARVLGVRVEQLLDTEAAVERKAGPTGKVQQAFEAVSRLPRRQQEKILEVVSLFVQQYGQRQG